MLAQLPERGDRVVLVELGEQPTWIIDPLDGTTNFVHGYWPVTVSIGLAVRGELVLGVIFNPLLDEMCVATKGGGATLNGRPIRVGGAAGVGEALVVNNLGASRNPAMNRAKLAEQWELNFFAEFGSKGQIVQEEIWRERSVHLKPGGT